jgi:hypothetical protein
VQPISYTPPKTLLHLIHLEKRRLFFFSEAIIEQTSFGKRKETNDIDEEGQAVTPPPTGLPPAVPFLKASESSG